jgi:hypothetical protein
VFDVFWKANKRNLELALDDLVEGAESSVSAVADAAGSARGAHGRGESDASEDDDRPVVIEVE